MQNGKEYIVYINANPAVARAINGTNRTQLNPGRVQTAIRNVSRNMAANFTTRNPIFMLTNFSRDYIYASTMAFVKEDIGYAVEFQKNIPLVMGALQRSLRMKGDPTNKYDRYAAEYSLNGGKTGYSHIVELKKVQKKIERDIKNHGKTDAFHGTMRFKQPMNLQKT